MKKISAFFFLLCSVLGAYSNVTGELKFARYLLNNNAFEDAVYVLSEIPEATSNTQQKDSINYYIGWAYYQMKALESSAYYFGKVTSKSSFYEGAWHFRIFSQMYLGEHAAAESSALELHQTIPDSPILLYQHALIKLLQRDFTAFDSLSVLPPSEKASMIEEWSKARALREKASTIKQRKGWKAAVLSALIPGAGKYYAGYRGKALSTFLSTSIIGGVAVESLLKAGLVSPHFAIAGAVFSIFYLGNVWGSYFSVQLKKDEINREVDSELLLGLQLTLHRNFE